MAFRVKCPFTNGSDFPSNTKRRVTELQVFLCDIIANFSFRIPEPSPTILRENCLTMIPIVLGEEDRGNQLPLVVSLVEE